MSNLGVPIEDMHETFPDSAQHVQDTEWITYAASKGLPVFTQDLAVYENPHEKDSFVSQGVKIFSLSSAEYKVAARSFPFGRHMPAILRRCAKPGPCFWAIGPGKIRKLVK